jgi:2-C-methyl-D-erythritol 4-phosphate cytidylyltransferase
MPKKIIAIVPAAGVGERAQSVSPAAPWPPLAAPHIATPFHGAAAQPGRQSPAGVAVPPKQYRLLKGEPMLRWAVKALLADTRIEQVRVAIAAHDTWAAAALAGLPRTLLRPCGGPSRAATVAAALSDAALPAEAWVLVHDAARPGLPLGALKRLIDTCLEHGTGGLLALPVADTVKKQSAQAAQAAEPSQAGLAASCAGGTSLAQVGATLAREGLWLAQTPQMFPAGRLLGALQAAQAQGAVTTDEASALERAGYRPLLIPGSARNFKVTWPEDFELMEKWL